MVGGNDQPPPTQTTQYTMSPEQRQILNLAMPAINSFGATTPQRYQGSTVAGFTDPQISGQQQVLDAAVPQGTLATNAGGYTNSLLSTDPNAMRDDAIAAATRPIVTNLTEKELPAIRSGTVANGSYGSSRQGIAESQAIRDANTAVGDTAAKLSASIYGTDVDARLKALGLIPQTQQAYTAPGTTTSAVGDIQQQQNQRLLDEVVRNFNFDTNNTGDLAKAQELVALLGGLPLGGTTSTGSVPQPNTLTTALGGAAAGASLGGTIGSVVPGVGTLAGAGVGALGGAVLPFVFK